MSASLTAVGVHKITAEDLQLALRVRILPRWSLALALTYRGGG